MLRLATFLSTVLLLACAGLPANLQSPNVSLADVSLTKVKLLEQHFVLELRVQNPNNVDLPIRGMDYTLSLNGRPFVTGVSNRPVTIPANGEQLIRVDAVTSLSNILEQFRRMEKSGTSIVYTLSGRFDVGRRVPGLPFEHRGEIRLAD